MSTKTLNARPPRKRKINAAHIPDYFRTARGKVTIKATGEVIRGSMYYLARNPSNEMKEGMQKMFQNVAWFISQSQYAPEQKTACLFVGDKCF